MDVGRFHRTVYPILYVSIENYTKHFETTNIAIICKLKIPTEHLSTQGTHPLRYKTWLGLMIYKWKKNYPLE